MLHEKELKCVPLISFIRSADKHRWTAAWSANICKAKKTSTLAFVQQLYIRVLAFKSKRIQLIPFLSITYKITTISKMLIKIIIIINGNSIGLIQKVRSRSVPSYCFARRYFSAGGCATVILLGLQGPFSFREEVWWK